MIPERYVPRQVSKISKSDRKVCITGRVADSVEGSLIMDDESGKIEVFTEGVAGVKQGDLVSVFCTLFGDRLSLDFLQHLPGADLNLLKTVDELYSKAGV